MDSSCLYMIFGILVFSCYTSYLAAVEFDHFVLSFQWPVTFCKNQKCKQPLLTHWTVHGFWPSNSNGSFVKDCSKSPFTADRIPQRTMNEMKRIWPDLLKSTSSTFWSYQWQKHGTCADVEDTRTVAQYFSKATELALRFNISTILKKRQIVEGNNFQIPEIEDSFRIETKHRPHILLKNVGRKPLWLWEVQLCFSKSFSLIDCHRRNKYQGPVLYPSLTPSPAGHSISPDNGQCRSTAQTAWLALLFVLLCSVL